MEGARQKLMKLREQGAEFTYANFAEKTQRGWIKAPTPAWTSWASRVSGAVDSLFDPTSAPVASVKAAQRVPLEGFGADNFTQCMNAYLGALDAAIAIISDDTFGELRTAKSSSPLNFSRRVFIVHGRDSQAKTDLEIIVREMGLEPIVLHRQPDGGRTLIEKFEEHADVGFAFVILTPDEIAYLVDQDALEDGLRRKEFRARPNVIFEFGYFVGRLGRHRTCCIYQSPVTMPTDLDGLVYKKFVNSVEEVAYSIGKELRAAGYKIT